jgi:hypothetical protein
MSVVALGGMRLPSLGLPKAAGRSYRVGKLHGEEQGAILVTTNNNSYDSTISFLDLE